MDVHWNNPFVGLCFYEQGISGPYGLYFSGGKGDNAEVSYTLMSDKRVSVPGYLPSKHGFHFRNHWPSTHITSITLPDPFGDILVGDASWGLCGGMSFASRDCFEAGQHAPLTEKNPAGEGDPLFDYIVRRLSQSLSVGDVADFVKFADPIYPDTDDMLLGDGRSWVMAHVAWPAIRGTIDSGHPCPIGIVIGKIPDFTHLGHQVCVYAYQLSGQQLTLWVYDPNTPGNDDVTMKLDLSRTDQHLIAVDSRVNVPVAPICFFTQSYEQRDPVGGWTHVGAAVTAVKTRSDEGAVPLFVPGSDGRVWSTFWPKAAGSADWSGWFPVGDNTFVPGAAVTAVKTRSDEGAVSLFVPGLDGRVWSTFWPAHDGLRPWTPGEPRTRPAQPWSSWFPLDGNTSVPGTAATTLRTRSDEGAVSLFVLGHDAKVWSSFWPKAATSTDWSPWFRLGDNTFPIVE